MSHDDKKRLDYLIINGLFIKNKKSFQKLSKVLIASVNAATLNSKLVDLSLQHNSYEASFLLAVLYSCKDQELIENIIGNILDNKKIIITDNFKNYFQHTNTNLAFKYFKRAFAQVKNGDFSLKDKVTLTSKIIDAILFFKIDASNKTEFIKNRYQIAFAFLHAQFNMVLNNKSAKEEQAIVFSNLFEHIILFRNHKILTSFVTLFARYKKLNPSQNILDKIEFLEKYINEKQGVKVKYNAASLQAEYRINKRKGRFDNLTYYTKELSQNTDMKSENNIVEYINKLRIHNKVLYLNVIKSIGNSIDANNEITKILENVEIIQQYLPNKDEFTKHKLILLRELYSDKEVDSDELQKIYSYYNRHKNSVKEQLFLDCLESALKINFINSFSFEQINNLFDKLPVGDDYYILIKLDYSYSALRYIDTIDIKNLNEEIILKLFKLHQHNNQLIEQLKIKKFNEDIITNIQTPNNKLMAQIIDYGTEYYYKILFADNIEFKNENIYANYSQYKAEIRKFLTEFYKDKIPEQIHFESHIPVLIKTRFDNFHNYSITTPSSDTKKILKDFYQDIFKLFQRQLTQDYVQKNSDIKAENSQFFSEEQLLGHSNVGHNNIKSHFVNLVRRKLLEYRERAIPQHNSEQPYEILQGGEGFLDTMFRFAVFCWESTGGKLLVARDQYITNMINGYVRSFFDESGDNIEESFINPLYENFKLTLNSLSDKNIEIFVDKLFAKERFISAELVRSNYSYADMKKHISSPELLQYISSFSKRVAKRFEYRNGYNAANTPIKQEKISSVQCLHTAIYLGFYYEETETNITTSEKKVVELFEDNTTNNKKLISKYLVEITKSNKIDKKQIDQLMSLFDTNKDRIPYDLPNRCVFRSSDDGLLYTLNGIINHESLIFGGIAKLPTNTLENMGYRQNNLLNAIEIEHKKAMMEKAAEEIVAAKIAHQSNVSTQKIRDEQQKKSNKSQHYIYSTLEEGWKTKEKIASDEHLDIKKPSLLMRILAFFIPSFIKSWFDDFVIKEEDKKGPPAISIHGKQKSSYVTLIDKVKPLEPILTR